MFRNSNAALELAMTHRVGAEGQTERCLRPAVVRSIAERVQRWTMQPEVCQSCQALPAAAIRGGLPLCGRCRGEYVIRLGRDPEGLTPRATRADDGDADGMALQGYGIVFNSRSVDMGFFEIIRPAAADRLESEKPDLRYLWNHDSSVTLGRVSAGTMRAEKRTRGVQVTVDPPSWASGHVESVERRDITGQSFGFYVLEDDWHLEEGYPVREVFDMSVIEFSGVSFPAYEGTTLKTVSRQDRQRERQRFVDSRLRLAR